MFDVASSNFLTIDATVQHLQIERVVRKDALSRDEITDPVIGDVERGQTQALLMRCLQNMVRNVTEVQHPLRHFFSQGRFAILRPLAIAEESLTIALRWAKHSAGRIDPEGSTSRKNSAPSESRYLLWERP